MLGRKVTGPDGRRWRVRRHWLPWEPRLRGGLGFDAMGAVQRFSSADEFLDGPLAVLGALILAIVLGVVLSFLTPLVFLAAEVVIVVVLIPLFVVFRLVLREPWTVSARTAGPPRQRLVRRAEGWRASSAAIEELCAEIRTGTRTEGWSIGAAARPASDRSIDSAR